MEHAWEGLVWKCCETKIFSNTDVWKTRGWTKYKIPWLVHCMVHQIVHDHTHVVHRVCNLLRKIIFHHASKSHSLPISLGPSWTYSATGRTPTLNPRTQSSLGEGRLYIRLIGGAGDIQYHHVNHMLHLRTFKNLVTKMQVWMFELYSLETFWANVSHFQHQREVVLHIFKSNILWVHLPKQSVHRILCSTAGGKCRCRQQHLQTT